MNANAITELKKRAEFHEAEAAKIRKVLRSVDEVLGTPTTDVPKVRRKVRTRRPRPVPAITRKARPGHGMGSAVINALRSTPLGGLTPDEVWERIDGKFQTSSSAPRAMLSVELQRLKRAGKTASNNGRWSLAS